MSDDMQETPKKANKDTSSHEEATVISPRNTEEKKSKTQPKSKVEKASEPVAAKAAPEPAPSVIETEPMKMKPTKSSSGPSTGDEPPQKDNRRTVLIVVIVAVVLLCCCCVAIIAIYLATGGWQGIQDLFSNMGMLALAPIH